MVKVLTTLGDEKKDKDDHKLVRGIGKIVAGWAWVSVGGRQEQLPEKSHRRTLANNKRKSLGIRERHSEDGQGGCARGGIEGGITGRKSVKDCGANGEVVTAGANALAETVNNGWESRDVGALEDVLKG